MTRARTRRQFSRGSTRGRRDMDFFCPARRGIRVGYASPTLTRHLSAAQRRRVAGRAVLILSANRHYALHGVRPGTRLAKVRRRLHVGRAFHVGLNYWYVVANGPSHGVLKVRHGVIQEVGIAELRLTRGEPPDGDSSAASSERAARAAPQRLLSGRRAPRRLSRG